MRVLVIDDDRSLLKALAHIIRRWGGQADCADSAENGVRLLDDRRYDFVLLDAKMPGRGGLWFLEHAHISPLTKVLVMSGFAPRDLVERMFNLGACAYLEKPFSPEELMQTLERHCVRGAA